MRNEPNFKEFQQAFSLRIEVAEALLSSLQPAKQNIERLKKACSALEDATSEAGRGDTEDLYRAYLVAADVFVPLADWKRAIRDAETDAQRFLSSAKLKAAEVGATSSLTDNIRLSNFLEDVANLEGVDELPALQKQLCQWSLPLPLFIDRRDQTYRSLRLPGSEKSSEQAKKLNTTVAFLKFDIDGEPAQKWNYLIPGTAYDLSIEVRVSNWPEGASSLSLTPITVDAREKNWLPTFRFVRPNGDGPFVLTGTGRAVLKVAHSFGSRPYEFLYAAEFDDTSVYRDVAIVGHRRLLLEGADVASNPLTGFSDVDRRLIRVRDQLRNGPGLFSGDIADTMTVLGGLGSIAAQALKNALFEASTPERGFQEKVTEMLQSRSEIGEQLQGHPEAAGGISDLTFKNVPIELKVSNSKVIYPKDCERFFDQTAAYAIGLGKRIGVLSVLDSSPKALPVGVIEDDIEVFAHRAGQSLIFIVVVVVRGGFPKPSSYSK